MGQYYRFVNKTREEESQISLPFNFGLPYAKSLEHYSADELQAMFRFVVKHNAHWQEQDEVVAIGDYGNVIPYIVTPPASYAWEKYEPEQVPPKKLEKV